MFLWNSFRSFSSQKKVPLNCNTLVMQLHFTKRHTPESPHTLRLHGPHLCLIRRPPRRFFWTGPPLPWYNKLSNFHALHGGGGSDYDKWVELSHPLDNDSPYWSGIPDGSVELSKMVYDWGNPMLDCLIQTFKFPGQFGTHIDFPGHFLKGGLLSEAYGARQLVYPLCVVDVSEKVKEDVHYAVTVQDILDYEAKYGPIPDGAFVALRTDWGKRWPSMDALSNFDAEGGEHTPGWSMEALKYIYETRSAAANGHETIDTDASQLAAEAGDLACERYVLSSGKLQVELLCNLDQVAPAGAVILVSYPNIKGATGLPARVWAVTP